MVHLLKIDRDSNTSGKDKNSARKGIHHIYGIGTPGYNFK